MSTERTAQVVRRFYEAIGRGDEPAIMDCLDDDIVFELPQDEHSCIIPALGTKRGHEEVADAFRVRGETTEVLACEIRDYVAQDDRACAVVCTKARCRATGQDFEIEDMHHLTVNGAGKIARWKVYFDPNTDVAAVRAGIDSRLVKAVADQDVAQVRCLLDLGADPNARDAAGLTALMLAAGRGNVPVLSALLTKGADLNAVEPRAGNTALHAACQGGNAEVVRALLDGGAFVDAVSPTTGHTPIWDAFWYKWPDIVAILVEHGASLNLRAHYGFTLDDHIQYEERVNVFGKERFQLAVQLLERRRQGDRDKQAGQRLMAAVATGDLEGVRLLLAEGAAVDERYPVVNGFNDSHTPLLVACRDGHTEIVAELLKAGADVNAVEPTFGAVPLHKAVYNGHAEITRMLVRQPRIDLDYQGATNGYTPLHDALWHGHVACAEALLDTGARVDLRGSDGKRPLDIALEVLGPEAPVIERLRQRTPVG